MLEMFKVRSAMLQTDVNKLNSRPQNVVAQSNIDPALIGDICVGTVSILEIPCLCALVDHDYRS